MKPWFFVVIVLMGLLTVQGALSASGDVIFQDNATHGEAITARWAGSTADISYNTTPSVLAIDITATVGVNAYNTSKIGTISSGAYFMNFSFYDPGTAIPNGKYFQLGMTNTTGSIVSVAMVGSGVCNQAQTSYRLYSDNCGNATGEVARSTGWHSTQILINYTSGTIKAWIDGSQFATSAINENNFGRFAIYTALPGLGFKITNITVCQDYCIGSEPPSSINTITLTLTNNVTGQSIGSSTTFSNITGTLTFNYFNITSDGFCVSYTGNGTGTNCTASGSGASTFFNVSVSQTVTGDVTVTNQTYQALLDLRAYRLFLNTSITNFNVTNNKTMNITANGVLLLKALNGTNNIQVNVAGNHTKNVTCTVTTPLTTVSCNVTGIYDNAFTIGAKFASASIGAFNITVVNSTLGGTLYSGNTANGSLVFSLLQGYNYQFQFRAVNYTSANATLAANASTNLYNFTAYLSRQVMFIFRDEITRNQLDNTTNMTLEIISDLYATNVSTSNGTLVNVLTFPQEYTFRYRGGNYTQRQYYLNVTDETNTNLTLYVIDINEAELVTVTVSDTGANLLEGATVKLLRYFLYCNCYEVVEMERTSFEGTTSLWAQPVEGYYKWAVDYEGSNYFISTSPETINVNSKFFSIDLGQNYYTSYQALSRIGTALVLNTSSGSISFTWSDPTGIVTSACITTYRYIGNIQTMYSQSCDTGATGGVLTSINVTDGRTYKYVASLNTSTSYSDHIIASQFYDPPYGIDFGTMGVWLSIVLLIVVALIFSYSAAAVLVSVALVVVIVSVVGLITFTTSFIAGIVAILLGLVVFLLRN